MRGDTIDRLIKKINDLEKQVRALQRVEVSAPAAYVALTGNQNVGGEKRFTDNMYIDKETPVLTFYNPVNQSVSTDVEIGKILFSIDDNSSGRNREDGAYIKYKATGTWNGSSTPANLSIGIRNGNTFLDDVVVISQAGAIVSPTLTTPNIGDFTSAQHSHSNAAGGGQLTTAALSDYATGSWTPVVADALSGGNVASVSNANGWYITIGRMVIAGCNLTNITTAGMTSGNAVFVRGLPFANAATSANDANNACSVGAITYSGYITALLRGGNTVAEIIVNPSNAARTNLTVSALTSGQADIYFTIVYRREE